jgi:TolB-like protein/Flp pilus assembly protein TadD/class 3 adenylate cyclase
MSAESSSELKFEIGHVLFIDIVGYSKLNIREQSEQLERLKQILRGSAQFKKAEAEGKLLRLPTGDGGALVFRTTPEAPVLCAIEIAKELKKYPEVRVRMGIHSGPVNEITDLNEQANIAGAGINIAQRVMDCGDAGHILISKRVADDLEHYPQWRSLLHELGDCEVKHGARVSLVNLYTDDAGNAARPSRLVGQKGSSPQKKQLTNFRILIGAILLVGLGVPVLLFAPAILKMWRSPASADKPAALPIAEKSIAVLPFENLSEDKANAYFTEGIQDEILTRLAKIADLKVISRTSTQRFKSAPDNLPQIAKQLGVANILEGSVQKAGDQVRVNVQLINAATSAHLWAETYDRKLIDIFAVESDIARTVADTLQAKLTGPEKTAIATQPTSDTAAYELYLKGRSLWAKRSGDNIPRAIALYKQVIARDPNYALAYSGLAEAYAILVFYSGIEPKEAFAQGKAAALKALQLNDNLAEAHAALAFLLCIADFDMEGSVREFQRAIALNPNYATAHQWYGVQPLTALGRFDEAVTELKRAIELDPLSPSANADLGWTLMQAGRYDDAIIQLQKTLEIDPTFYPTHYNLGVALQLKGDLPGAIAQYRKGQELSDDLEFPVMLATAEAQSGDKSAAVKMLSDLEKVSKSHYSGGAYWRALLHLSLGNRDEAIHWLEQSVADRAGSDIVFIKVFHFLNPLRGDPRFDALVQKIFRDTP